MCDNLFLLPRSATAALYAFGVLNAVLYASLLPLWEGFDEPFHYASVQSLSRRGRFPVLNKAGLSEEIRASLPLAPASHVVRRNLPQVTTFEEYFRLDAAERARRRAALAGIPPRLGDGAPEDGTNYEAQQAPLAYLLLAPFDRAWASAALPARIWRLRLVCGLAAVLLGTWATLALARRLGAGPGFAHAAAFLLLCSQMWYAASAHVANDWLALPLMPVLLLAAVAYKDAPSVRGAACLGLALAAGLLAKAYYLALVPLPLVLVSRRWRDGVALAVPVVLLAGPWYLRNWVLYGNLTGLIDTITRHGLGEVAGAALRIPWGRATAAYARWALWTGNNSFATFSAATLNILLLLGLAAAACGLYAAWKRRPAAREAVLAAGILLFCAVLVYSTSNLYLTFGEAAFGGGNWYAAVLFPCIFVLLAQGLEHSGTAGRVLLCAMLAAWGYVLVATWWLKLIPLYGGYSGRVHLPELAAWYLSGRQMLADTALVHPEAVLAMAAASTLAAVGLAVVIGAEVFRSGSQAPRKGGCSASLAGGR